MALLFLESSSNTVSEYQLWIVIKAHLPAHQSVLLHLKIKYLRGIELVRCYCNRNNEISKLQAVYLLAPSVVS